MKLLNWLRTCSIQEKLMIVTIVLLIIFIATRWSYITRTVGTAFRDRFVPPTEQADSSRHDASSTTTEADPI